ncbi:MAG: DoxX family membrane protein [Gammaproteobacteria bacterium]
MRIASVGHGVFAAFMIGIGILGLVQPQYAAIWDGIPKALPGRELLPYLCALVALACGLGLLWPRSAGVAARVLLAYLLVWMILFKGRFIVLAPTQEGSYQSAGENAVIVAGAWVLYAWLAVDWDKNRLGFATGDRGVRIARVFYGLALIAFGLSHFFYLQFTAPLIPSWLMWPVFWAYFTGAAYLAAGAAVLSGVLARLAATLAAVQMASFLFLVWLPIFLAGKMTDFNWGEIVVNIGLVAGAWVVVDSYRGQAWLPRRKAAG